MGWTPCLYIHWKCSHVKSLGSKYLYLVRVRYVCSLQERVSYTRKPPLLQLKLYISIQSTFKITYEHKVFWMLNFNRPLKRELAIAYFLWQNQFVQVCHHLQDVELCHSSSWDIFVYLLKRKFPDLRYSGALCRKLGVVG